MAPTNKTCIVIEVPCDKKDQIYSINENKFFERIKSTLFDQTFKTLLIFWISHQ